MGEAVSCTRPWHDCPRCPKGCGAVGCLEPYNPSGWYGPSDATVFCPACGGGWYGTEDDLELALIAETWWDAFNGCGLSEAQFYAAHVEDPAPCGKTCFRRGCQRPDLHFGGRSAKLCSPKFHPSNEFCGRCRFLLDGHDHRKKLAAVAAAHEQQTEAIR